MPPPPAGSPFGPACDEPGAGAGGDGVDWLAQSA
jgi:hypothetical protein